MSVITGMAFQPDYQLLTSASELRDRASTIYRPFGFDIETGYEGETREKASLHPEENFLAGISIAPSLAWARYIPLRHDCGTNADNAEIAVIFWELLAYRDEEGRPLGVAHGAKFELRCMARWFLRYLKDHPVYGPAVRAAHGYFTVRSDTMLESFAEGTNRSHGLKDLTARPPEAGGFGHKMAELLELFPEGLTMKEQRSIRFNVLDQHEPAVVAYACEDSLWCLAHHLRRWPRVKDSFVYKLEMSELPVVCAAEDEGIAYDWNMLRDGARRAKEFGELYRLEVIAGLSELAGKPLAPTLNLGSSAQLGDVLYKDCGLPVPRWTKGGKTGEKKPSVDAKVALKGLAGQYPAVARLLGWKGLEKLRTAFLDTYEAKYCYAPDGLAHPGLLQHGTITGRHSAAEPNYEQSPKKYRYELSSGAVFEFNFRDAITVPPKGTPRWWELVLGEPAREDAGWYFLGFDYSQIELRVLAGEAGETALIEAFRRNEDVHVKTAALMLGKSEADVTDDDRQVGKTMNFALGYQMTPQGLAERLGITVLQAEDLFAQYFATYRMIKSYTDRVVSGARRDGYVMTRFGRRVPIWDFDAIGWNRRKDAERTAGNAPIQGAATGDYVKIAMVRADRALKKAGMAETVRLVMNVHDALEFYVRRDIPPADVIAVLQPAVVFSTPAIAHWPPMEAKWHMGVRWGSVLELELLDGGGIRVVKKGKKTPEPALEDEDVPPPVVTLPPERPHDLIPVLSRPGPPRALSSSRLVIIEAAAPPAQDAARSLAGLLRALPGPNRVVLRVSGQDIPVSGTCGLSPEHEPEVSVLLGGASVRYDPGSVDLAALGAGLSL